jgi:hypothetical protein
MEPNNAKGTGKMGHHKIAAAVFVGSLILGAALVLSAELIKPARYEFHSLSDPNSYLIFDTDSGRATTAKVDAKTSTELLGR